MQTDIILRMVLDAWKQYLNRADDLFEQLSDEQLLKPVAPRKNTGKYLLGHLTAVHDRMIPLLGLGQQLHPELVKPFEETADGAQIDAFTLPDLRKYWHEVNDELNQKLEQLSATEWFERHSAIGEEDFKREPHRNRLNVMINRTNHIAWHYGQLLLLKGEV